MQKYITVNNSLQSSCNSEIVHLCYLHSEYFLMIFIKFWSDCLIAKRPFSYLKNCIPRNTRSNLTIMKTKVKAESKLTTANPLNNELNMKQTPAADIEVIVKLSKKMKKRAAVIRKSEKELWFSTLCRRIIVMKWNEIVYTITCSWSSNSYLYQRKHFQTFL